MKHFLTLIFTLLISLSAKAQTYRLYTSDVELPSALVHDIFQDHTGLVWIATEDGLTRFNGVEFYTYKHKDGDGNSLAHNLVRCVTEDKAGNLYVGTHLGVQCYNRAKDSFTPIAKDDKGKLKVGNVNRIIQMSNGEVWATGNDLFKVELKGNELYAKGTNYNGPHNYLEDILEDKEGNIWVTHLHDGVYVSKKKTKAVKHYLGDSNEVNFHELVSDANGNVFLGTHGLGVMQYNKSTDSFETIEGTRGFLVSSLYVNDGQVLVGTDGTGLFSYNIANKELSAFPLDNKYFNSERVKVHAVMRDEDGDLWLGLFQKGVMFLKNKTNLFETIGHRTFSRNIIGSEAVNGITEDAEGSMWICTDNDGVYSIEKDGTSLYHFSHRQNHAFPVIMTNLAADKKGRIWVASYTDGLGYFTKSGIYVKHPLYANARGKEILSVMDVIVDKEGRLWAATLGNNIYCIDTNTDTMIEGCSQIQGLDNWQCALYMQKDGTLCVGTFNGSFLVEIKNGKAKVTERLDESSIINAVTEDSNANLWLATSNGLVRYDKKKKKTITFTTKDGLPTNTVYSVKCGNGPYVWAATSGGLVQMSVDGVHIANFGATDGLQGNEFSKGASFLDSKGRVWFGGINGVTYFNPDVKNTPENTWDVRVVGFYLNNQPVNVDTKSGFWNVVDTDVMTAKEFNLCADDNSFTIEFAIRQLNSPEGLRFEYTLNDGAPEMLPVGVHGLSFTHLPHGTYRFKVYVHGYPEESVCEVTVHVHTVWYNHWIAWIFYVIILAFIGYKLYQYLQRWFKTQRELREHQHQDEINNSKLLMFTNISHEIRTPMTLIISPLEKLMKDDEDEEKRHSTYDTMHRNASRILNLINQLMDVRKIENGKMDVSLSKHDIIPIIGNICESFVEGALEKDLTFTYIHDGLDRVYANIDVQHFDKIFVNLISNAMKFVPEHGVVTVCVSRIPDNKVQISVNDNGIGIPEEERASIFERFYQVRGNANKQHFNATDVRMQATGGTGVGLHLAKAIVEMHGGTIRVDDTKDGVGCRIVVELPILDNGIVTGSTATEKVMAVDAQLPVAIADRQNDAEQSAASEVEEAPVSNAETVVPMAPVVPETVGTPQVPVASETPIAMESLALPEVDASEESDADTKRSRLAQRRQQVSSNYKVLIVDDDPEIANYISQELSDRYHCAICSNGKDALESVLKNPPHLVISDVMMPEMSGIELTKRIKSNVNINHIPVVLVTALSDTESNVEGLNVGAAAYLTKPFNVTLLKTTVDNIIKSRLRLKNVYEGKQTVERKIPKTELQTPDERLMKRVMKVIEQHIFDHNLSVETLAQEVGISRVHLNRKLKELTNQTTTDFIKNIRLKRAAELLSQKKHSIAEVADMVGFQNANNFSTAFRKLYGMSPREYMAQKQE